MLEVINAAKTRDTDRVPGFFYNSGSENSYLLETLDLEFGFRPNIAIIHLCFILLGQFIGYFSQKYSN